MSEELDIQNLLRDYAAAVPDNGFTEAVLARAKSPKRFRLPILAMAGGLGGLIALSQMPSLWDLLTQLNIPTTSPLAFTVLGVLGFVAWAALDKGWGDAV